MSKHINGDIKSVHDRKSVETNTQFLLDFFFYTAVRACMLHEQFDILSLFENANKVSTYKFSSPFRVFFDWKQIFYIFFHVIMNVYTFNIQYREQSINLQEEYSKEITILFFMNFLSKLNYNLRHLRSFLLTFSITL